MRPADVVEGRLNGSTNLGAPCVWITDDDGAAWELAELPEGYRVEFERGSPIIYADTEIVARVGDRLVVRGIGNPPDLGSVCMVGRIFLADEIDPSGSEGSAQ